jgi:hypothetical protein
MSGTTQTLRNLLQLNYQPGITRQFNDDFPNLRYIRQNSRSVTTEGDEAVFAIETGLNEGGGFHGESADVALSGTPTHRLHRLRLKQMTFRLTISLKLMRKARTNAHAFARGFQKMMSTTRDAVTLTANQYLWGDGSGVMARVVSQDLAATDTVVLDRAYGITGGGAPESIIRPGQVLHILDTKGFTPGVSADRGTGIVETVAWDTGTPGQIRVKFKPGYTLAAVAAHDYVYLQNTIAGWFDPDEEEDNRPAMGLLGFYDNAAAPTLQGLSTATEPMWAAESIPVTQATVVANLRTAKNRVAKRVRRGRTNYVISSYETHERYSAELDEKVEFRNVNRYDSGWDFSDFYGRPWFMDHTAPDQQAFFVPSGNLIERHAVTRFIEFVDEGTGMMYQVPNKTVFDLMLTAIYEYGIRRRNALVRATGFTWVAGAPI